MDKYKIAFMIGKLSNGGAERVIANLANQFCLEGYDTSVITFFETDDEYSLEEHVKRITIGSRENGLSGMKATLFHHRQIKKLIIKEQYDVLVSFMASENIHATWACLGTKTKSILSVRNEPTKEYPTKKRQVLAKSLFKLANGMVFQTEDAKKWFPSSITNRSVIIPNPVDKRFFFSERRRNRGRIVAFGRIDTQKNYPMMIDAFSKFECRGNVGCKLYIFGKGPLTNELNDLIITKGLADRVQLCGQCNDVPYELGKADVLLLSSDFEGMPNAVMEAMVMGVPVISTDCPCGGPRMLINDGEDGYLVEVGNADMMSEKLNALLNDEEKYQNMSKNAREKSQQYSQHNIFLKWDDYIRNIIK